MCKLAQTFLVLAFAGCSSGLDGPAPSLSKGDPLAISPALVCGEQTSTTLDITGRNFSPVPANIPDSARLLLPTFTLERSAMLDGSEASEVEVVYSGDPKSGENVKALRWLSETHMQATLDRGRLPVGVYDARVVNPNGEEAAAEAALTVVDKPSLAAQAELLLCDARSEQELVVEGSGFLKLDGALPALKIEGQGDALSIGELTECQVIEQSDDEAAICSRARLSLDSQLPVGTYEAKLVNPEPAACQTDETLRIRVVAGPQLDSEPIESLCLRGQTRVLVVRGKGFLELDGTLPSATLAGKDATVVAVDDCEAPADGQRSCKKLQLELPVGSFMSPQGATGLTVKNPAPASCSASVNLQLRDLLPKEGQTLKLCPVR
jgi:hypothetical protein